MNVILAAGGTGGHMIPAHALAAELAATAAELGFTSAAANSMDAVSDRAELKGDTGKALDAATLQKMLRPDEVETDRRYDEIWSNPPIRIGKPALHDLLLRWLPRLAVDGRAVLVVGRNLGADSLQRWLEERGHPTMRLGSAKGFRVLEVRAAP